MVRSHIPRLVHTKRRIFHLKWFGKFTRRRILPHQVYQRVYKQKNIPPLSLPQSWQRGECYPCRRTLKIRLFPVQFRKKLCAGGPLCIQGAGGHRIELQQRRPPGGGSNYILDFRWKLCSSFNPCFSLQQNFDFPLMLPFSLRSQKFILQVLDRPASDPEWFKARNQMGQVGTFIILIVQHFWHRW